MEMLKRIIYKACSDLINMSHSIKLGLDFIYFRNRVLHSFVTMVCILNTLKIGLVGSVTESRK